MNDADYCRISAEVYEIRSRLGRWEREGDELLREYLGKMDELAELVLKCAQSGPAGDDDPFEEAEASCQANLGVSFDEAVEMHDAGELDGTVLDFELNILRDMCDVHPEWGGDDD